LAVLAGIVPALVCVWLILQNRADRRFLLRIYLTALALRWAVGLWIYYKNQQAFFGADASTYDYFGYALSQAWEGEGNPDAPWLRHYTGAQRPGWGMYYYVAAFYYLLGRNPLAVQLSNAALGAATCVLAYRIGWLVYPEQRVARLSAILTAFSPSLVLWSSQGLKDAPIVFCLCLCACYTLKLRQKFEVKSFVLLLLSLFCLYSLRNYASYILFMAIAGTLILAARRFTPLHILQGGLLVIILGLALAYVGAGEVAQQAFDLKRIQSARAWGAQAANSGFGGEVDITDPQAALRFLPAGVLYVLFAPFPWMISNLRQLITLPELVVWWAMVPLLLRGYWFALRHRLRESFTICLFSIGLTLAYALFQTNVGTAYRHRAQLYVFFFVFISIGLELKRQARLKRKGRSVLELPRFTKLMPAAVRMVNGKSLVYTYAREKKKVAQNGVSLR
jgi:4-amino-4-deoxy-L-arabinose transferase-like glycosyltransferase